MAECEGRELYGGTPQAAKKRLFSVGVGGKSFSMAEINGRKLVPALASLVCKKLLCVCGKHFHLLGTGASSA